MTLSPYIKRILEAHVYEVAHETPIHELATLSEQIGNRVLIKREDLQSVFSFKIRGAYNKISRLSPAAKRRGVIAASAGNHAQGVALAAHHHGINGTIVMPITTPTIKVDSVRRFGGKHIKVILKGDRFDEACAYAEELAKKRNATFVHPYDDPEVIAGQGTIGMEILRQHTGPLDAIFVPVGGGGLIAGIATYVKYLQPEIRIIGVEAEESACLTAALKAGRRVKLSHTGIFADGVSVSQVGKEPFRLARKYVDETITVSNDEICAAVKRMFDDTRSIAEPAGALALAGLLRFTRERRPKNRTFMAINSGANVDFNRLRYISERYGVGLETECLLAVTIPERPKSLVRLCDALAGHDMTEFNYRYSGAEEAHVFVGAQVNGQTARNALIKSLRKSGLPTVDISGNELAKMHVCHMVGGRALSPREERLLRFEFPERPGILREFLTVMRGRWNVSMFHYRQHGGTSANVLVGLQYIENSDHDIDEFIKELGYPCIDETANPAYRLFLAKHFTR